MREPLTFSRSRNLSASQVGTQVQSGFRVLCMRRNISLPLRRREVSKVDETVSGVKADLAVKIFGDNFDQLDTLSAQVLRDVQKVRGASEAQIQLTSGVPDLRIHLDRAALARYNLNVADVQRAVGASGSVVSQMIDGQKRYDIALRLPDS